MSIRYIGSKARLSSEILDLAGDPEGGRFVDPFAGTGVVCREAANRAWPVRANDLLPSATALTRAQLVTEDEARFLEIGGYAAALEKLNSAAPIDGFFFREYAPRPTGSGRKYFTPDNAQRIDGMRRRLSEWTARGMVGPVEQSLLLGDLIQATNSVANTAGTYGCFLKAFAPNALRPVIVRPRELLAARAPVQVTTGNANAVEVRPQDLVYLDPPYTKRQYAAYYHILETLVAGDEPVVGGVTGLRPWKDRASDFCYKRRALSALVTLLGDLETSRTLISYSNDGHIDLGEMRSALEALGDVHIHSLGNIRRYTPNDESRVKGAQVHEVIVELKRSIPAPPLADMAHRHTVFSGKTTT